MVYQLSPAEWHFTNTKNGHKQTWKFNKSSEKERICINMADNAFFYSPTATGISVDCHRITSSNLGLLYDSGFNSAETAADQTTLIPKYIHALCTVYKVYAVVELRGSFSFLHGNKTARPVRAPYMEREHRHVRSDNLGISLFHSKSSGI